MGSGQTFNTPLVSNHQSQNMSPLPSPPEDIHHQPTASSSALPVPTHLTLRGRMSSRTLAPIHDEDSPAGPLPRRRSSLLSFQGLDSTRQSAGDFIRPGLGLDDEDEIRLEDPSHWQSSPLAFAFLPALAGLFFTNGSGFVTDILLLVLAALFLNWSVRLPWDWYRSAQAQFSLDRVDGLSSGMEEEDDEHQSDDTKPQSSTEQERAAASLRQHESLALLSTFAFPAFAAYLLHVIRSQLSRPSEGLVSDYNLTIFLLAAEIRPVRQLIRLITNRTLHLQRVVNTNVNPLSTSKKDKAISELTSRLAMLEEKLSGQHFNPNGTLVGRDEVSAMSSDIKKRYEPRLDALERAVRRYEKRATTLTLLTEQRLQSLENRLQDALSLAAVAAQSSGKPGVVSTFLATLGRAMSIPLEVAWLLLVWPVKVAEAMLKKASVFVLGPQKQPRRRDGSKQRGSKGERKEKDSYFARQY